MTPKREYLQMVFSSIFEFKTKESKHKVRFDESINTKYEIFRAKELTREERAKIWITREDLLQNKKESGVIAQTMMRSKEPVEETEEFCCRGLGKFLPFILVNS